MELKPFDPLKLATPTGQKDEEGRVGYDVLMIELYPAVLDALESGCQPTLDEPEQSHFATELQIARANPQAIAAARLSPKELAEAAGTDIYERIRARELVLETCRRWFTAELMHDLKVPLRLGIRIDKDRLGLRFKL